jgi:hypothetical protein
MQVLTPNAAFFFPEELSKAPAAGGELAEPLGTVTLDRHDANWLIDRNASGQGGKVQSILAGGARRNDLQPSSSPLERIHQQADSAFISALLDSWSGWDNLSGGLNGDVCQVVLGPPVAPQLRLDRLTSNRMK